ncbi:MAG: phospholipid carrier-dependent glycosyltransferase [Anaerolineae bacterium]|nr:phospholipid carrier-dependent glycosyltransferase [Anaerolineae bacterium]
MTTHGVVNREPSPVRFLIFLFALFGGLGLLYSLTTPLFEAPDEVWHYAYVRWLAKGHDLPSLRDDASGANQETAQPPFYYAVAALLSAPFDDADLDALFWHNPNFGYQAPKNLPDNKNMLIHTDREAWPWRGAVLAIRAARLASWLFGFLTVVAAYGLGYETFKTPGRARFTALMVALNPQFLFISGVASNDSAAAALATLTLWALARTLNRGLNLRRSLLTGALVGLAALAKVSNVALVLPAALTWIYIAARQRQIGAAEGAIFRPSHFLSLLFNKFTIALGLATLLTGGWWYARNLVLYNDPLAMSMHTGQLWARSEPASLVQLLSELPMVYRSFWGAFGWGHIAFAPWVYGLLGVPLLLSLAGWVATFRTRRLPGNGAHLFLCASWFAIVLGALIVWMRTLSAPHGRLLFPAIAAWSVLLVGGWAGVRVSGAAGGRVSESAGERIANFTFRASRFISNIQHPSSIIQHLTLVALLLLDLAAPLLVIRPAFALPRLVTPEAASATVGAPAIVYGETAQLLGVRLLQDSTTPGGVFSLRACWMARQPMDKDYTVFIHLVGLNNSRPGERYTYPGLGRFPTSLWPVGQAFCDTYRVSVEPWAPVPELYDVWLGLYDDESDTRLQPDSDPPVVAQVRVAPEVPQPVAAQHTLDARLGDAITLLGYDAPVTLTAGSSLSLTLYWRADDDLYDSYKVFVHLLDADNVTLAQDDTIPHTGRYPTSVWRAGDVVPDVHVLATETLTPGVTGRLIVGLYRPDDGARLPVSGADAAPSGDAVLLQEIVVAP